MVLNPWRTNFLYGIEKHWPNQNNVLSKAHSLITVHTVTFIVPYTARKNIFYFFKCSEKMLFPKKLGWNMIFLVLPGRWYFLFPKISSYSLDGKWKMMFVKKNTWKYIFFKCSEKMVFPKKSHWNKIFIVVLSGKMIVLFPKYMILFFRHKMEDDLSQKDTWNKIFFSNAPKRWFIQKKLRWNMIFLVLSGKMVFFFREGMIFFLWTENERWSFSRNTWKYDIICIYV